MVDETKIEAQAIISYLSTERAAANDRLAQAVGQIAVRDAKICSLEARVADLETMLASAKAANG